MKASRTRRNFVQKVEKQNPPNGRSIRSGRPAGFLPSSPGERTGRLARHARLAQAATEAGSALGQNGGLVCEAKVMILALLQRDRPARAASGARARSGCTSHRGHHTRAGVGGVCQLVTRLPKRPAMPRRVMSPFERPKVPRPHAYAACRSDQLLVKAGPSGASGSDTVQKSGEREGATASKPASCSAWEQTKGSAPPQSAGPPPGHRARPDWAGIERRGFEHARPD